MFSHLVVGKLATPMNPGALVPQEGSSRAGWSVGPGQPEPPDRVFGGSAGRSAASETDVDSKIHVPRRKNCHELSFKPFFSFPSPAESSPVQPMMKFYMK